MNIVEKLYKILNNKLNISNKGIYLFIFLFIISSLFFYQIINLSDGFVFNRYPFISSDGFDWITEGYLLFNWNSDIILPIGRSIVFVSITYLDAMLGQNGFVIAFSYALALFITIWIVILSIGSYSNKILATFTFTIAVLFAPINYFRLFILSESIAVALSVIAFVLVFRIEKNINSRKYFLSTILFMVLAGLTQTYGLIAPSIALSTLILKYVLMREWIFVKKFLQILTSVYALFIIISIAWYVFLPYENRPSTFNLLKLSFDMMEFYINAWGYYFAPFIPLLISIFLFVPKDKLLEDTFTMALWLTIFTFMILNLLYQWADSRFIFIYWPFFILAIYRTFSLVEIRDFIKKRALILTAFLVLIQSFGYPPHSYWTPKLEKVELSFQRTWLNQFYSKDPRDVFHLNQQCGSPYDVCKEANADERSNYEKLIFNTYQKIGNNK